MQQTSDKGQSYQQLNLREPLKKTALTIDFQTRITMVKTKHHMSRICCKNFSSIRQLTKWEFKILRDKSKLESSTRPRSMHNVETRILQFNNVK